MLITSARGPMLGTHTAERWGKRLRRYDKPTNAAVRTIQIRSARRTERELWMFDDACERFDAVETITFEPRDDAFEAMVDLLTGRDEGSCGCYCRRCVVNDDHGGCLTPWEHRPSPTGVYHADDDFADGGFWG